MSAVVQIPTALRSYTGDESQVRVQGGTVGEALDDLSRRFPQIRRHLYAESGELRMFVNVYINDTNVRDLSGPATPVAEGDTLLIVPSIAGGGSAAAAPRPRGERSPPERALG